MSDQDNRNNGGLVLGGRRALAPVAPTNPLVARGLADLAQGRLLKVKEAISLDPDNGLFYYNRGVARLDEGDCDNAMKDFDEAIRLFGVTLRLDPIDAVTYLHRGRAWLARGGAWGNEDDGETARDFDRGIKDFDEAIRLDPVCVSAYIARGRAWTFKDVDKAIKDYDEAIRLDPNNALCYYNRGRVWSRKRNWDEAIKNYGEAIRLDPNNALFYRIRGDAWMAKSDCDKQLKDYDEAIRLDPNNAHFYRFRGDTWMNRKDYDNAIKDFGEAIRLDLDPKHGFFFYRRGQAWCFKKDFGRAIEDFGQAIERSPRFVCPYVSLAWLLATCPEERSRDGMRAIQVATKACDLGDWEGGYALDALAAAYAAVGQFDEAVRYQTKALDDPHQSPNWDAFRRRLELYKQKKPYRQTI